MDAGEQANVNVVLGRISIKLMVKGKRAIVRLDACKQTFSQLDG